MSPGSALFPVSRTPTALTQSLAAAPVRSELIACFTPALEGPFAVGAALAAVPLLGAFIHIWEDRVGSDLHSATLPPQLSG